RRGSDCASAVVESAKIATTAKNSAFIFISLKYLFFKLNATKVQKLCNHWHFLMVEFWPFSAKYCSYKIGIKRTPKFIKRIC
nr:hypothetical protein [Alistipes sp.]